MPRVSRACERNIVPNLPAPIRPTVTGRPAASRSSSKEWRFTGSSARILSAENTTLSDAENSGYWHTALETNASLTHSLSFGSRRSAQKPAGQRYAEVMSRLAPR